MGIYLNTSDPRFHFVGVRLTFTSSLGIQNWVPRTALGSIHLINRNIDTYLNLVDMTVYYEKAPGGELPLCPVNETYVIDP